MQDRGCPVSRAISGRDKVRLAAIGNTLNVGSLRGFMGEMGVNVRISPLIFIEVSDRCQRSVGSGGHWPPVVHGKKNGDK
jgi:hypothetical protein